MAVYTEAYRRGMGANYSTTLREALLASGQRGAVGGRPVSQEEIAAIAQGVLSPYLTSYGPGLQSAYQMDIERAQAEEEYQQMKEQQKIEEKAAETAAVGQAGSLAILGGHMYGGGGGGATAGTTGAGAGSTSYGGAYAESAPAASGGGSAGTGTTTSGAGWGNAFAFVGGGMVGYAVSPYGQQVEEGTGRPGSLPASVAPGGHRRRGGERLGMMATGAAAGGAATGSPYGVVGGAVGGFFQENPETGKRGYQELWSWYGKPAWHGATHDIRQVGRYAGDVFTDPGRVGKKILSPKSTASKAYKKVKKLF